MLIRIFTLLLPFLIPLANADVKFTTPAAGSTVTGGGTLSVKWKDSGESPAIDDLLSYQLFLCAGGNSDTNFIQLAPIVTTGQFSQGNAASGVVQAGLGGSTKNAYFLKMIAVAKTGGTIINYSSRFTLSGMTGVFPPNVKAGIAAVSGTSGPDTENDIGASPQNPAPGAGPVGEAGPYSVPYTLQTGLTRYAPMQPQPGTKITKDKASMQFSTSAFDIAVTYLGPPKVFTTFTQSQTFSVQSIENTATPAAMPQDDMQKFLNRWKD